MKIKNLKIIEKNLKLKIVKGNSINQKKIKQKKREIRKTRKK